MQAEWAALRHRVAENQRRLAHLLNWSGIQYRDQLRSLATELARIEAEFVRPEAPPSDDALAWIADAHRRLRQHVEPLLDQFEGLEIESSVTGRKTPSNGTRRRSSSAWP